MRVVLLGGKHKAGMAMGILLERVLHGVKGAVQTEGKGCCHFLCLPCLMSEGCVLSMAFKEIFITNFIIAIA